MRLAALQAALQARVLAQSAIIVGEVAVAQSSEEAAERLGIYTNAYSARLAGALASTFPQVQRALGEEAFAALTTQFSRELPSRHRSVRDFGEALPAYLAFRLRGVRGRGLRELAQWEWTMADAFDAPDDATCSIDLGAIPPTEWANLRFEFTASLRRIDLATNALDWRRATDAARPARWRNLDAPVRYAIWRTDLEVYFRALDAREALALDSAMRGDAFGEVCERLLALEADAAFETSALQAASLLQSWMRDRWIVRVHHAS